MKVNNLTKTKHFLGFEYFIYNKILIEESYINNDYFFLYVPFKYFKVDVGQHEVLYEAQAANFEFPRKENKVFAAISNCETQSKRENFIAELRRCSYQINISYIMCVLVY